MRKMDSIEKNKKIFEESFEKYGDSPKSCLWDEKMVFRYEELTKVANLEGSTILEIGCGIGGFYDYLIHEKGMKKIEYKGVDLVEGMIELAKKKYPTAKFETRNVLEDKINEKYDYVILCGVFNVMMDEDVMKELLKEAFSYCEKGIAFNFISSYVNFREEEISYHNPQEIFSFCVENLSKKVSMNHHYKKCDVSMFVYR